MTDWAELEKEIHLLGKRRKQELNILSVDFYVPQFHTICEKYKESHPDVTLNITFAQPQDFVSQMLTCHYDVGFSFSIEKTSKEAGILDFLPTESGHFFVVTSKKHPFASLESISAQELVNCLNAQPTKELRLIPQGTLVTYPFADIPQTQQDITLNNLHLMVKMGMWVVSLPEHVAYDFRNDCAVIPLESSASYEMGFYWIHGECTEQTNRFIFFVENFCKK
ncbi:MAG: substrate-binding domain-containing protein [Oscillospiraceae bacterium]|nr:substrate-binding domain-containing protein [Oscillospiraceae bacterium]